MQFLKFAEVSNGLFSVAKQLCDDNGINASFPNVSFEPTSKYVEVAILSGEGQRGLGSGFTSYEGILQITSVAVQGVGIIEQYQDLEVFENYFKPPQRITTNSHALDFYQETLSPQFIDNGSNENANAYSRIPLSLNFRVF